MQTQHHVERAHDIAQVLPALQSGDHVELRVEMLMHACTHLLTAILHHDGTTDPDHDQVHAHHPPIEASLDGDLMAAIDRLAALEYARALVVRGDVWDADDVEAAGFDHLWPEFVALAAARGLAVAGATSQP